MVAAVDNTHQVAATTKVFLPGGTPEILFYTGQTRQLTDGWHRVDGDRNP